MAQTEPSALKPPTLRLTDGGPAATLFHHLRLDHSGRKRDVARVALIFALGTWLPLVLLSGFDGVLFKGTHIPLLYDFGPHVRFLFSLPVLILADIPIANRVQRTMDHLVTGGLIPKHQEQDFIALIEKSIRLRDSRVAAALLIFITAGFEWWAVSSQLRLGVGTWMVPAAGGTFSQAGCWFAFVSLPIYQFIVLRWGYRIIVWGYFFSGLAKLDLLLTATHPDGAGGIGFLGRSIVPFGAIGLSLSAVFSATIASRVLFAGEDIYRELPGYGVIAAFSLAIAVGPLLFFMPKLYALRYQGLAQYGMLATAYTRAFQARWITPGAAEDAELLGNADIQSLADLGNSYQIIQDMKLVPVTPLNLIGVTLPSLIPALPLAAIMMPLGDLLRTLAQVIL